MVAEVKNKRFFTVNRVHEHVNNKPLMMGKRLDVGEELNPSALFRENVRRQTYGIKTDGGEDITPIALINAVREGKIKPPQNIDLFVMQLLNSLNKTVAELLFEQVRKEEYPECPSRQKCLWLVETIEETKRWEKEFAPYGFFQTLEVEATGVVHYCDEIWLQIDADPYSEIRGKANRYWKGEMSDDPVTEIIFEGIIEVVDVHQDKSESD